MIKNNNRKHRELKLLLSVVVKTVQRAQGSLREHVHCTAAATAVIKQVSESDTM